MPEKTEATTIIELSRTGRLYRSSGTQWTREGIVWLNVAGLMFLTGIFKGINLLILLSYALVGLWLVNWRLAWRSLRRLKGRRLLPGPIFAGTPIELGLELTQADGKVLRGLTVEDHGPEHEHRWLVVCSTGREPMRLRYEHVFQRRGRYVTAPLYAGSRYPFGLVGRVVELAPAAEWLVFPRLGRLHVEHLKQWLARTTRGDGRLRRQMHVQMQSADIHGLRDFRPGDSPRWIHWRSSARRNQVLVREFEDDATPDLMLIVEPWLPDTPSAKDLEQFEDSLSLAATVCWEWCRDRLCRLTLIIAGAQPVIVPPGRGMEQARQALEQLASQHGGPIPSPGTWAERMPLRQKWASILVVTSRPGSPLGHEVEGIIGRPVAQIAANETVPWYERSQGPRI